MPKLTKRLVDALDPDPGGGNQIVWDTEVRCFGLRITSAGVRSYVLQYRTGEGRLRRLTIGKHGSPWTCEEARGRARELLSAVRNGIDPLAERTATNAAPTVKDLCEAYLRAAEQGLILGKKGRPKKSSTLATDRGRIARHIIPLLGSRKVNALTPPDINRFMRDVMLGKTAAVVKTKARGKAVVEGGVGTATRTVGLLGGILSFAVLEGIIPTNPTRGIRRPADGRRDVRLSPEEYARLGSALRQAATEGENASAIAAIRLLALTGCRRGEIEKLRWREVDMAAMCLRLADTKEGASIRPIGTDVIALLKTLGRDGSDYVLPGTLPGQPFRGLPKVWKRVIARAGLGHITPHTLRHAHASVANDLGLTEATISAIQGRSTRSVTGAYIHHLDRVLIEAADKVAANICTMMGDRCTEAAARRASRRRRYTLPGGPARRLRPSRAP